VTLCSVLVGPCYLKIYGPLKCWYPITTLHGVTTQSPLLEKMNILFFYCISLYTHRIENVSKQNVDLNRIFILYRLLQFCMISFHEEVVKFPFEILVM